MTLSFLLSLALILLPLPQVRIPGPGGAAAVAGATWAVVQAKSHTAACTGNSTSKSCTVNNAGQGLAATGTGHAIFVAVVWTDIDANTPFISSLVGDNGSDTVLTHCPTSPATGQIWKPATNVWYATDCYYILNSAGGTNSFTATVDFGGGTATSVGVNVYVVEISKSSGSITIDTEAAGNNGGSTCSSCVVPSITFTGSNDYVLTWIAIDDQAGPPFGAASISGSYSNPFDNSDATDITAALAGKVNVTTYSAPTWTLQQTSFVSMSVIALK